MDIKNKLLHIVRTPLFKQRVVKDKTKYNRKVIQGKATWQEHINKQEDKL
tara:strand:- start:802 stop:951 length:150 start_codon:yes stop_codon:yes gene_type:complete